MRTSAETFEFHRAFIIPHTQRLLDSFRHWLHRDLIPRSGDPAADARALFEAAFVVLSGGPEDDQILNYGNAAALRLWAMDWDAFVRTPSRHTAEPVHQEKRAEFLRRVREVGYVENYAGTRISSKGERFRIEQAIIWNLVDGGRYAGQAATFSVWEPVAG